MGSIIMPTRRGFLLGAAAVLAAPAIVRATSIMPVHVIPPQPRRPRPWHSVTVLRSETVLEVKVDGQAVDFEMSPGTLYDISVPSHYLLIPLPPMGSLQSYTMRENA